MVSAYLTRLSTKLNKDELEIVKAKYLDRRIDQMNGPELLTNVAECLLRIHIITGWNLPDDQRYIQLLTEELHAKLQEDFSMLNFQEISLAMRKNGVGKKDWGKNMNLELICGVLADYCEQRSRISEEEERLKGFDQKKAETIDEARKQIALYYHRLYYGYGYSMRMPNEQIHYDTLKSDGLLNEGEMVFEFFDRMLQEEVTAVYYKIEFE